MPRILGASSDEERGDREKSRWNGAFSLSHNRKDAFDPQMNDLQLQQQMWAVSFDTKKFQDFADYGPILDTEDLNSQNLVCAITLYKVMAYGASD